MKSAFNLPQMLDDRVGGATRLPGNFFDDNPTFANSCSYIEIKDNRGIENRFSLIKNRDILYTILLCHLQSVQ